MADHSVCRSCGANIVWATVGGKRVPLNATRVQAYVDDPVKGIDSLRYRDIDRGAQADAEKPYLVRISHFLTCPQASQHSRGGRRS